MCATIFPRAATPAAARPPSYSEFIVFIFPPFLFLCEFSGLAVESLHSLRMRDVLLLMHRASVLLAASAPGCPLMRYSFRKAKNPDFHENHEKEV